MWKLLLAFVVTLLLFFGVAFIVYAALASAMDLKTPGAAPPFVFLSGVLIVKAGHALAFVLIYALAGGPSSLNWGFYAFLWWLMFVFGEVGQAVGFDYSWPEACAGAIAETLYFPAAAFAMSRLLKGQLNSPRPSVIT